MCRISIIVALLIAVLSIVEPPCHAQTRKDEALAKAKEAVRLEDEEGKYSRWMKAEMDFWDARQLSKVLDYAEFRNFLPVIESAKEAA